MAFWRADRKRWVADVRVRGKRRLCTIAALDAIDAERLEREMQHVIDAAERPSTEPSVTPPAETFGAAIDSWIARRSLMGKLNVDSERTHLRHHLLPLLGDRPLCEINEGDVLGAVESLLGKKLASRTLRNIHASATVFWADLVRRRVVTSNPWPGFRSMLPTIVDRDPDWRPESTFDHAEVERLIFDASIPQDRRVVSALASLAGLRIGEAAALRWRHYDAHAAPLGRLRIGWSNDRRTKTKEVRIVPVHPALAAILDAWRARGWPNRFGREPAPNDLVAPGPPGPQWSDKAFRMRFQGDLRRLGLRVAAGTMGGMRSPHGLRASLQTLAVEDGAVYEIIDRMLHRARGRGAGELYLRPSWEASCRELAKLRIGESCYQTATARWEEAEMLDDSSGCVVAGEGLEPSTYGL